MARIACPYCGERDQSEFERLCDGFETWPTLDADPAAWFRAVYVSEAPARARSELWRHAQGCRSVLRVSAAASADASSVLYASNAMEAALRRTDAATGPERVRRAQGQGAQAQEAAEAAVGGSVKAFKTKKSRKSARRARRGASSRESAA